MPAALVPLSPATARALCTGLTLTGEPSPAIRAWIRYEIERADDTADTKVGALRNALWWLAQADAGWRLLGHAGRALAEALEEAGEERADHYGYQGSAGQTRGKEA